MRNCQGTSLLKKHNSDKSTNQNNKVNQLTDTLSELLGGSANTRIWLNSPHTVLGGRTPQSYLDEGHIEVLEYFINAIETGQPS